MLMSVCDLLGYPRKPPFHGFEATVLGDGITRKHPRTDDAYKFVPNVRRDMLIGKKVKDENTFYHVYQLGLRRSSGHCLHLPDRFRFLLHKSRSFTSSSYMSIPKGNYNILIAPMKQKCRGCHYSKNLEKRVAHKTIK